jgi:FMN phosphatase YigB (HAD superfamily)
VIRIVMFDLGLTLIDEQKRAFPHASEAVKAISKLKTSDKKSLRCCLVSDFTMATPPVTPKKIRTLFDQYLEVLDQTGLRPLFEPVDRRVTLSTHANALKPDRAVFETALRRLRSRATLAECVLITESTAHITAARTTLGMQALQFSATSSPPFDFDDWGQAPAMVARLVDPHHTP